ncbi:receptor expression-enhancing protein 4-like isoform X2 [Daktulosphaira vitifoliae]|nr:receptor expression-enhancing protein 4-like isoform X2 [Daktulosphaira vitifoliae]
MSYKVLKTKKSSNYGIWLMYWITFSLFTSVETATDIIISPWLPFYNELKLLFLYMTYPTSDSSLTYVYKNIVSPFIKKHEKDIDAQINNFKRGSLQTLMSTGKKCTNMLMILLYRTLQNNGFVVGQFINTNINSIAITNTSDETDGNNINWDNNVDNSDNESNDEVPIKLMPRHLEPEYSFSEMYSGSQDNQEVTQGPPSSNTRKRKKAH